MAARRTRKPKTETPEESPPATEAKDPIKDILALARSPRDPSAKIHDIIRYCIGG